MLTCLVEGPANRAFVQLSPAARLQHVSAFVNASFGGAPEAPEAVVELNWADEPWTRGAYSTFHMPGVLSGFWDVFASIYHTSTLAHALWRSITLKVLLSAQRAVSS